MIRRIGLLLLLAVLMLRPATPSSGQIMLDDGVLRGEFEQERHLEGFSAPLVSRGRFVLVRGKGLIWKTETPFAVTTVITAAGLVQVVNGEEMFRLEAAKLRFLARLYDMLSGALIGDWSSLESGFSVARTGDAKSWRVKLVPSAEEDPAMPFDAIEVVGGDFVDEIVLTKTGGDFDKLSFSGQVVSPGPITAPEAAAFDSIGP